MSGEPWIIGGDWSSRPAPHRRGGDRHQDIIRAWTLAATCVAACGLVLFGPNTLMIVFVAVTTAIATESVLGILAQRPIIGGISHAGLIGLLLALTLPVTVEWYVPMFGSLVAVLLGKGLFGGFGHYIWQPALVGRVFVGFLFAGQFALGGDVPQSRVLSPGNLVVGDIDQARPINTATYRGWFLQKEPAAVEAWQMARPVETLRQFADGKILVNSDPAYETLLRDWLPPWQDTVLGLVPGGLGETCSLALIIVGLYLIYRGYLRWQLPVAMIAAATIAASILPIELPTSLGGGYDWFPILEDESGRADGVAYVLYNLTSGQLLLGAFLLAGDMMATPMRARGQVIFAAGVGFLTIFMRLYGVLEGECYWSILIMNSLVGVIDSRTKRPVLGMAT